MEAPGWFVKALEREFDGRLRLRWSDTSNEWHIEEKVSRAQAQLPDRLMKAFYSFPETKRRSLEDKLVRARDGYAFVLAIRPGDRMPCPVCGWTLHIPTMEFKETRCPHCSINNVDTAVRASFWPLADSLLDHLRNLDPLRDGHLRAAKETDAANTKRVTTLEKDTNQEKADILKDAILRQLPSVGYTGKEIYQPST